MAFRDKKDEEEPSLFLNLEKTSVLQDARTCFNQMPIKPTRCLQTLTKIIYVINQGDTIGPTEATETFFAMTKLFQCPNVTLRRMVYLTIKEMANLAEDVIIVTASLTKDMTGKEDAYRASAIRALCRITDSTMLQGIERYMKQAIVDGNSAVQSAAIVSSLHLAKANHDVVKRWVNEIQQALQSRSSMVQYHALGLLYHLKQKDRLAVTKLVSGLIRSASIRSPYAYCLLIRFASKVIEDDPDSDDGVMLEFLESCLRNKSEMVIFEAARALVSLKNIKPRELHTAVSVLQLFLGSPKPTLRFAAVRTLNKVAMSQPNALKPCQLDMENLITDSNRSIATLAITTLLKTGTETSIDRLMNQIQGFMSEISDEFKVVVVNAIQSLCLKYPKKHSSLMGFLAGVLRDEGGYEYKKAIVDTLSRIIENVPEAREAGLSHLCEFIEDCEYPELLTRILHMLGDQGAKAAQPHKYIRFIYNRLILESSVVRAAAVSALAKFGTQCNNLRSSIVVLLRRCLSDGDDEVRDRATFFVDLLEKQEGPPLSLIVNSTPISVAALERALLDYTQNPSDKPFDLKTVPVEAPKRRPADEIEQEQEILAAAPAKNEPSSRDKYAAELAGIPEFASFGPLFNSSSPVALTEAETEYTVKCIKHIFPEHVVFQFNLENTLNDQLLEDISIVMTPAETEVEDVISIPCPLLEYHMPVGMAYVAMPLDPATGGDTFAVKMEFTVKDVDPDTGECDEDGYADNYQVEDVELSIADFMLAIEKPNFATAWEQLSGAAEREDSFALSSIETLEAAVDQLLDLFGMAPCEKSGKISSGLNSHTLFLSGVFVGGHEVLVKAKLAFDQGVTLNLIVRSSDEQTAEIVASAVA